RPPRPWAWRPSRSSACSFSSPERWRGSRSTGVDASRRCKDPIAGPSDCSRPRSRGRMSTRRPYDLRVWRLLASAGHLLRSRMVVYCGVGFAFGLSLTLVGYLVDYYALYNNLPQGLGFRIVLGLHRVTPVHYFTDGVAPVLAAVGALAGRLHDRARYYSHDTGGGGGA